MEMAREEFRKTQLLPAMAPLLDAERDPWTSWVAWLEKMGPVPQEEVTEVRKFGLAVTPFRAGLRARFAGLP